MRECINRIVVKEFATRIKNNYREFNTDKFCNSINPNLNNLGLFERLDLICQSLYIFLPQNYPEAVGILINSLGDELDSGQDDLNGADLSSNNGFIVVASTNYVAKYGMHDFDLSMKALYEMTKRFSSEGAIRYFILQYPERCFELFRQWVLDDNVHVRRLVSEGLRPRLPWAIRLKGFVEDPTPIFEFLRILKDDNQLYVRRSVANNINDIAKDHPDLVVTELKDWSRNKGKNMQWLIRHGLRTLIKNGDIGALEILGYRENPELDVNSLKYNSNMKLGDALDLCFNLESKAKEDLKLVIDYTIFHKKANGSLMPKVFKLKNIVLKPGEIKKINKPHVIKAINTRKYYSGEHRFTVQINGKEYLGGSFQLSV